MGFGSNPLKLPSKGSTKGQSVYLEGMQELVAKMRQLEGPVARKSMVTAIRAGLAVITRQMRKEINAIHTDTEFEHSLKVGMRKQVKGRFLKGGVDKLGRGHKTIAKTGYGVARKESLDRTSLGHSAHTRSKSGQRTGVTQKTAHWFVLGTPNRQPSQMPDFFRDVVSNALTTAGEYAMQKSVTAGKKRLIREAQKHGTGRRRT